MPELTLYNSLTRKKERFEPMTPGQIKLYVCGMTVYDDCHMGHARAMVSFDAMVRFLRSVDYDVNYVRNITDIDDKIIKRAAEKHIPIDELTDTYIKAMDRDSAALGCIKPDLEPRATAYVDKIIQLIERLIAADHAYVTDDGDVCFEVASFKDYGKLSHKDLDGLRAGARIDVQASKRSPLDFVLWKQAKPDEPSWPSPWGEGRPGWHIECSAMSIDTLGEQFDIHGGGLDLQFPHHENEIAQSECATGKQFANYWLHIGMLKVNQEKMSKSLGNFFTIADVLKKHEPEVLRYFLLSSHYRSPLNYSDENLELAHKALSRLYQALRGVSAITEVNQDWLHKFQAAMLDDFNTPEALSVMFQLSRELNKSKDVILAATLRAMGASLGLLSASPDAFLQSGFKPTDEAEINTQIERRNAARKNRDFATADAIRDELLAKGIELEDTSEGTTWRHA